MLSLSTQIGQRVTFGAGFARVAQMKNPGHRSGAADGSTVQASTEGEQPLLTGAERAETSTVALHEPLETSRRGRLAPGLSVIPPAASGCRARGPD
jgi:hypothetical protein